MSTRQEIEDSIRRGQQQVQQIFQSLGEAELDRTVHPGDGGWTAREVLAHLAGRARGYERMLQMAEGGAAPGGAFDVDRWNRERIDERIHQSRDDLLKEFQAVHDDLIRKLREIPEEGLRRNVTRPTGQMTVGEMLALSGGRHSINHSLEVARALGKTAPAS